jgi:hypothetical protein
MTNTDTKTIRLDGADNVVVALAYTTLGEGQFNAFKGTTINRDSSVNSLIGDRHFIVKKGDLFFHGAH